MVTHSPPTFNLFEVLRRFQHCTGHITTGSLKGKGNQYIQLVKVLYCKLPTNGKHLPAFPLEAGPGTEPRPQRWEARMLPHSPTLASPPTFEIKVPIPARSQVGKMVVACRWFAVYSTEASPTVCTGFFCPSRNNITNTKVQDMT